MEYQSNSFTITDPSGGLLSGTAVITGLPSGITSSQSYNGNNTILTITLSAKHRIYLKQYENCKEELPTAGDQIFIRCSYLKSALNKIIKDKKEVNDGDSNAN